MKHILLIISLLIGLTACNEKQSGLIDFTHPMIKYQGRIDKTGEAAKIYWPGSSVKIMFRGKSIKAVMQDDVGDTYYNVIVDNHYIFTIKPGKEKKSHLLASMEEGVHSVELFRRTEFSTGTTKFYGFEVGKDTKIFPPERRQSQIVFYGNSVTTGYANEDTTHLDRPDSIFTNNYKSYAAITARHFKAGYHCIARGGIGFMASWIPFTMPQLFDRLNPNDEHSEWDFRDQDANLVIVNLGQNDSWILKNPKSPEYQKWIGAQKTTPKDVISHYKKFIHTLLAKYPEANIICTLGSMDVVAPNSPWPKYIKTAAKEMNSERVYTYFFPFLAKDTHPGIEEHQKMATGLIGFIKKHQLLK